MRLPDYPHVLVGTSTADDAGVVRVSDDLAIVQTVDFFPPMVDDPAWFGRIGAANSLSDVYAMGGIPIAAVCVYGLPKGLPEGVPAAILNGAVETLTEANTPLIGGHTVKDTEIKFGLCVTGRIHPDHIVTNAGAQVGDVLVLTKPLGSGFLCTAIKNGTLPAVETQRVMEVMATLNAAAAEAMMEVEVHAATDVTGFGLLGHLSEMASGSGTTIALDVKGVPRIDGLDTYATKKNTCGGLTRNAAYVADRVAFRGGSEAERAVLCDPQTSGGLVIAVAEDRADALIEALNARRVSTRAVIGRVEARGDHDVVVG